MEVSRSGWKEMHPLENPLILEQIFGSCSVKDLKACRQVSKLWRDTSLKAWRSSAVIIIISGAGSKCSMSEFLEFVMDDSNRYLEVPFTKYFLDEDSPQFWELCGGHVKVMELWRIRFHSVDDFRDVVYKWCPNMEQLTLRHVKVFGGDQTVPVMEPKEWTEPQFGINRNLKSLTLILLGEDFAVTWMELLSHFPSLAAIHFRALMGNHDKLFRSVSLIRERDPSKLNLKHVSTECVRSFQKIPEGLAQALMDPSLQLESLSLQVCGDQGAVRSRDILSIHGASLKKLELQRNEDPYFNPCDFIVFPAHASFTNLQEVVLYSKVFVSMSFLKLTPNLRKLVFFNGCVASLESTNMSEMSGVLLSSFKELEIHWELLPVDHLQRMLNWLPSMEKLSMPMKNEQFEVICKHCPNLVTLNINESQVDDAGITGFDPDDVEQINENGEASLWRPVSVPRANITGLTNLQSFSLLPSYQHRPPDLGYCSAVYGIQEMANLKHLRIEVQNDADEMWNRLHSQYPWQ